MVGGEESLQNNTPRVELKSLGLGKTHFDISRLKLAGKTGAFTIPLLLRKTPIDKITAQSKIDGNVVVGESKELDELMLKATKITGLPAEPKLRKLMELTRSTLKYFGKAARKEIKLDSLEKLDWLDQNVTSKSGYKASLAETLDRGYGICGHFTALYAVLAQQSGLDVVVNHADGDMEPINIVRSDNNLPLFKEVPVGKRTGAHIFLEVLKDNQAIPVDPTTNLIGLSEEERKVFETARYYDVVLAWGQQETDVRPPNRLFINLHAHIPAGNSLYQGRLDIKNLRELDFSGNLSFDMTQLDVIKAQNGGLEIVTLNSKVSS